MVNIDNYILIFSFVLTIFLFYSTYKIKAISQRIRKSYNINEENKINNISLNEEKIDYDYLLIKNELEIIKNSIEELKKDVDLGNSLKATKSYATNQPVVVDIMRETSQISNMSQISNIVVESTSKKYNSILELPGILPITVSKITKKSNKISQKHLEEEVNRRIKGIKPQLRTDIRRRN
ncbi:hypothetical protein H9Q08_10085 [Chryseobacterium sp. PS-8]|uniref:LemA family protein n=1 Tax=Chryseobacterium indicum TaxID=2766954 RepID=A0ABS9C7H6_9FLAO|nr:hypothetical protein [Chryseobacterium sp. PS-8]MCF2219657.1 hypothetical protein [Chryseobacterium sp. PS-8]